jgi:hypothetical protein
MQNKMTVLPIYLGLFLTFVGLGFYFGLQLYEICRSMIDNDVYPETARQWVYYLGIWFIVLGAFAVVVATLWLLVQRLRKRGELIV